MATVICGNPRCHRYPSADKCLIYNGKCYCNEACLMEAVKSFVITRIRELKGNVKQFMEEVEQ